VVHEEQCEGLAVAHILAQNGLRPDWVVIGEPTDLQLARGQRGRVLFRVSVKGRSSHASTPERGVNAIYGAARAIVSVELLAPQLAQDAFLGRGSIAVTEINSTSASRNAVPEGCTLYVDRRLTAGETEAKALAELRRAVGREGLECSIQVADWTARSYTGLPLAARQVFPCWVTSQDAPLVGVVARAVEETLGFVPQLGRWDFSTDGVHTAGVAGIPTVGFGPGEERYAHAADERVRVQDLEAAARVYADLAVRLLGRGR
jgi:putative selenium metabolism hydrolase